MRTTSVIRSAGIPAGVLAAVLLIASGPGGNGIQVAGNGPPSDQDSAANGAVSPSSEAPGVKLTPAINDVLRLSKAKVSSEVIRAYIKNQPGAYNPTATQIIALKEAGVASEVLEEMVQHRPATRIAARAQAPPAQAPAQPPPQPQLQTQPQQAPVYAAPTYTPVYESSGSSVYVIPYPTTYSYWGYNYAYPGWASFTYWPYWGVSYGCWPYGNYGYYGRYGCYGYPYYNYCGKPYGNGYYAGYHGRSGYGHGGNYPHNSGGNGGRYQAVPNRGNRPVYVSNGPSRNAGSYAARPAPSYSNSGAYRSGGYAPRASGAFAGRTVSFQRPAMSGGFPSGARSAIGGRSFGFQGQAMSRPMGGGGFRGFAGGGGGGRMGGRR